MLDGLDLIDWSKLRDAYGPATKVPKLIRALTSSRRKIRDEAYDDLYQTIWHQGTIYEATAYAVPFLIELLEEPIVSDKSLIFGLLKEIATGRSYLRTHLANYRPEEKTPEFFIELNKQLDHEKAVREAVDSGFPTYLKLLEHPDSKTLDAVLSLLSVCLGRKEVIESILRQHVESAVNPIAKAKYVASLCQLWFNLERDDSHPVSPSDAQISYLLEIMNVSEGALAPRFEAALGLVRLVGERYLDIALPLVEQSFTGDDQSFVSEREYRFFMAGEALEQLPQVYTELAFKYLHDPDPAVCQTILFALGTIGEKWRWVSAALASRLVDMLEDVNPDKRRIAVNQLGRIGKPANLAYERLVHLSMHDDSEVVRTAATSTVKKMQRANQPYVAETWLYASGIEAMIIKRKYLDMELPQLIESLQKILASDEWKKRPIPRDLIAMLGKFGASAKEAVPLLQKLLDHNDGDTRLRTARILWQVDPGQTDIVLPVLLANLQTHPSKFTIDSLGQMGRQAQAAAPILHDIVDSPIRVTFAVLRFRSGGIDIDDELVERAKWALKQIEGG